MAYISRLVFLDFGLPEHTPKLAGALSECAEDHRRAGEPIIWVRLAAESVVPRGDLTLDVPPYPDAPRAGPYAEPVLDLPLSPARADLAPYGGAPLNRPSTAATALAVVETMALHRVDAAHCFAYGDLCLDDFLLKLVGNPRVVPCCQEQAAAARARGFPVIDMLGA